MYRFIAYMQRDLLRWSRAKLNVASTLALPMAWLVFVGLTLPLDFGDNYLDFITPSILVLTMMAAGLSGGINLMFDKTLGYLNKFLAMPAPRESILLGKIAFISIRGLLQSIIILVFALIIGATVQSPAFYLWTFAVLIMFGVLMAAFGTTLALFLKEHDTYAAVQAMISMPLFFTSTALMPYEEMPSWLATIARLNPVSYAIDAIRAMADGAPDLVALAVLGIATAIMLVLCSYAFRNVAAS